MYAICTKLQQQLINRCEKQVIYALKHLHKLGLVNEPLQWCNEQGEQCQTTVFTCNGYLLQLQRLTSTIVKPMYYDTDNQCWQWLLHLPLSDATLLADNLIADVEYYSHKNQNNN